MKLKTVLFTVVLFIAYAFYFTSGSNAAVSPSKVETIKKVTESKMALFVQAVKSATTSTEHYADKDQYEAKLASLIDEMPTLNRAAEPRADSENQIHGFQSEEFIEGHLLAQLRKFAVENEKFQSSTQSAYAGCAERRDLSQSVRAICFMRAMEISIKLNNPQYVVELNVPVDVRQLALRLVN